MTSRFISKLCKKVWVRAASFLLLALLTAYLARVLSPYLPKDFAFQAGADSVAALLKVLTSSMLAVTTFSLSIAVFAFATAAGSATPRATVLLQEDRTTQNVLATFLGAFLFGLVGLISLYAKIYDASGKIVVFLFTVVVIGLVVITLISWINHLMQFGRMDDTLSRVEEAATAALRAHLDNPYLGGQSIIGTTPRRCIDIRAVETGYVQYIDMEALHKCAEKLDTQIYVRCLPGQFMSCGEVLLSLEFVAVTESQEAAMRRAFTIGSRRTFESDPRFGLIVLSEIASKALSPAVNDPGTAISILGRFVRILSHWHERTDVDVDYKRLYISSITVNDVIEDAFRPIGRDGASLVEVQIRLQKALLSLSRIAPEVFANSASQMSLEALERAEATLVLKSDLKSIRAIACLIQPLVNTSSAFR